MTPAQFRRMALSMPEATESAHMGHPDFRVQGKIFATLRRREGITWGMVKLSRTQQRQFVTSHAKSFMPVGGGWGASGATDVRLTDLDRATLQSALFSAWLNAAPKRLIERETMITMADECRPPDASGGGRQIMTGRIAGKIGKSARAAAAVRSSQQKGRQQGSNTGKEAWKSNQEHVDSQPGPGQVGQRPRKDEPFGSTPGEVRGHPGGKRGQAKGGKRGTKNSRKAKSKRSARKST